MLMITASGPVEQVRQRLRADGLVPTSIGALWQWGRIKRARQLRGSLDRAPSLDGLSRVALIGAAALPMTSSGRSSGPMCIATCVDQAHQPTAKDDRSPSRGT